MLEGQSVSEGRLINYYSLRIDLKNGQRFPIGEGLGMSEATLTRVGEWLSMRLDWTGKRLLGEG